MKKGVIAAVAAVALVVVALAAAFLFPILSVGNIKVEGAVNADPSAIQEATGISNGSNMLRVDTAAAAQGVSQVPWVDKVTVSRSWPNSIAVNVVEHSAVGYIMDGATPQVINTQGVIFLSGVKPEGVPEFKNTKVDDAAAIKAAATAVAALPDELRGQLERVEAPDEDSIALFFPDNRKVFWGSSDRADEKAEATRVILTREGTEWNVSNPSMPTVKGYTPPPAS